MGTAQWWCRLTMGVMSVVLLALGLVGAAAQEDEFVDLSMIELEAHEEAYKPSFSVCKYLLEETKERLGDGDRSWPHVAHHIAHVRSTLPEHVRTDCDHFIKHNKEDIMTNFLQLGMETAKDVRLEEHAPEPKQKKKIPSVWAMMEEQSLVENHGVAFYQDVLREASPFKWCPRLELCEINYFIPSPHVLPDTYLSIKHNYDPDNIEF